MKLSMTGQEKGDLLIRVGKKAGNTHFPGQREILES